VIRLVSNSGANFCPDSGLNSKIRSWEVATASHIATDNQGGHLTGPTRHRPRLTGIDLARLIAIVGMVMVHFGPNPVPETTLGTIYDVSHGRASILFVFVAGIGATLLTRGRSQSSWITGTIEILARAAILLPLGLWLQQLDHGVLVILHYYAIYFVLAAALVRFPSVILVVISGAFFVLGPIGYHLAEFNRPGWFDSDPLALGASITEIVRETVISGSYPLVTWGAPLALGIWVGRQNLARSSTRAMLIGAGIIAIAIASLSVDLIGEITIAGTTTPISNGPHSQTHLWLLGSIGSALAVTGISLELAERFPTPLWPLVAAGQLALTIYVGHLILLDANADLLRRDDVTEAFVSVGVFMAITIALATLWRIVFSRGPLEALFRVPTWIIDKVTYGRTR
jgi:uncharacterized membrane protein